MNGAGKERRTRTFTWGAIIIVAGMLIGVGAFFVWRLTANPLRNQRWSVVKSEGRLHVGVPVNGDMNNRVSREVTLDERASRELFEIARAAKPPYLSGYEVCGRVQLSDGQGRSYVIGVGDPGMVSVNGIEMQGDTRLMGPWFEYVRALAADGAEWKPGG